MQLLCKVVEGWESLNVDHLVPKCNPVGCKDYTIFNGNYHTEMFKI